MNVSFPSIWSLDSGNPGWSFPSATSKLYDLGKILLLSLSFLIRKVTIIVLTAQLLSLSLLLSLLWVGVLGGVFMMKMVWISKTGPKTDAKCITQISTNFGHL